MILTIIITAIAVSLDGMIAGFAYGVGKISVPKKSLLLISVIPIVMSLCTMAFAGAFTAYLSEDFIKAFGFLTMFVLACFSLRQYLMSRKKLCMDKPGVEEILADPALADVDHLMDISLKEGLLVGFAVGIDASAASASLAFYGASILFTPLLMGLAHFVCIGLGNSIGRVFMKKAEFLRLVSVAIFLALAFYRLMG